ncbi:MAG TPA: hypothetical protein PKK99_10885 [Bacteroidia bacterium]|nr:hypothetical protein [Bacteroidia bacterium]
MEYVHDETNEVYYVHLEDDWEFKNSYDWIFESIKILRSDPDIIKVLCNSDSPHPCVYDHELLDNQSVTRFGYLNPWVNDGIKWYGFSWNPGVTRWDYLKKFVPFPRWEQDLSKVIHDAGYEVVRLEKGVCTHIGQGRSTHE